MLRLPTPHEAQRLREYLTETNYTHDRFQQSAVRGELPLRGGPNEKLLDVTEERSALNVLLRWFFVGTTQSAGEADLIPRDVLTTLIACGLLRVNGEALEPCVMLTPCDGSYFAADAAARLNSVASEDLVLWPNPTTRLLQLFSVRSPSRATLDLGAGCGIVGILAKSFSDTVTATDLNPRAAEFTRFNARLNGVESIECLVGDTFAPVAGRTFDLILANPPFFVTPTSGQMYCENEMELDQYCRRVIREAPAHLSEGGFFQAVLEWVQITGQSWQERLSEWLEGCGCDVWVLRTYIRDAEGYAKERLRPDLADENYPEKLAAWMDYYRRNRVEEVHGGILAMRRRSGRNWQKVEGTPVEASAPFGQLVLDTFATQEILHEEPDDAALLAMYPRLPEGAELAQRFRMEQGSWNPHSLEVVLTGAAPAQSAIERQVAGFLARCNGARTLAELADELAAAVRVNPAEARASCCSVARTLASRRILQLARS